MSKLEQHIKTLILLPVVSGILTRLKEELSLDLRYHNFSHTFDVINEALYFGIEEKLSDRELQLLAIAAAFHDAGFLYQNEKNEEIGAKLAEEALRHEGGYSANEISIIAHMIEDTKLIHETDPQKKKLSSTISGCLLDADVSNFGRDDFFEKSDLIITEKKIVDKQKFNQYLLGLLLNHRWYTKSAHKHRQHKKEENLIKLRQLIL